ncbi:hypothetical protein EXIGLDRAFT_742800 [Exidia glandulosa HHB12029]|uniref:Uncharacterized protein n=1 Tax=Exidia glandulosa HHB12029 TaxID=1314781 RepID=A0A165BGY9_EXIGL|nr:hypothetical protein EXIGLDRAFT_742800 [Exidia glandulosa HHB12029]
MRKSGVGNFHERAANEDVYKYLCYFMQPKPAQDTSATAGANGDSAKEGRDYSWRISGAIFSIRDLFKDAGRDGPKSVKFPEKMLKVLDTKLQNIAMGKDPTYHDQHIRRTIAIFYGTTKDPTFARNIKDNRKIEELILTFATTATGALRKDPQLAGDGWKIELNKQLGEFILILRDCLRGLNHVSAELTARLDMYTAKLAPSAAPQQERGRDTLPSPAPSVSNSAEDMPLVKTIARLFKVNDADVQRDVNALKRVCTEKAALTDLKASLPARRPTLRADTHPAQACLKNINAGLPFPGRREDFETDAAYQHWRTQELSHLSQLMVIMVQFNPELAKSTPSEALPNLPGPSGRSRHGSISSRYSLSVDVIAQAVEDDDDVPMGHTFVYIPPAARKFYKRLVELAIQYDLEAMHTLPEDQEVSLGILSPRHLEVINECAIRWRIPQSYRVAAFMDIIKYKYEREEVPLECIPEGLQMIQRAMHEVDVSNWPKADVEYLAQIYGALFNIFLAALYHQLEAVRDSGLLERFQVDIASRVKELEDRVRIHNELFAQPGVNRALPLLLLTDVLEKMAKTLDKRFPEPLLGQIDLSMYANAQLTASSSISTATATKISAASAAMKQPAGDKDKTDVRSLLLNLASRLIERAPETTHALADRFALHLDILQVRCSHSTCS